MPVKSVKIYISKNKKNVCLMSQGSLDPKTRFLGQKVCSLASLCAVRHKSEYRGHPFRVREFFLQPIIKDRSNAEKFSN